MTVTRVPAAQSQPADEECEVDGCINLAPPWDPLCLDHRGPDPELQEARPADERRGLDGNGAMSAADLPRSVWGAPQRPAHADTLDMDANPEVRQTKCLALSDDRVWPQQCWEKPGHAGLHDWERTPDSPLTQRRVEELRDTPSDRLPVRTPGAALRGEEGSDGPGGPGEAARPGASAFPREVVETWTA